MRFRSFALALALLVAAAPVIGVVCAMDCDQPPAMSLPCHDAAAPHGGITLSNAPHACDHDHSGASPALFTSTSARDSVATAVTASAPTFVFAILPEAHAASAGDVHGPPGLSARRTSLHAIVLRI